MGGAIAADADCGLTDAKPPQPPQQPANWSDGFLLPPPTDSSRVSRETDAGPFVTRVYDIGEALGRIAEDTGSSERARVELDRLSRFECGPVKQNPASRLTSTRKSARPLRAGQESQAKF